MFANKQGSLEVLKARTKGMSDVELSGMYDRMVGPGGLNKGAAINMDGVATILKLRSVYGEQKGPVPDPMKYVDLTIAERARAAK